MVAATSVRVRIRTVTVIVQSATVLHKTRDKKQDKTGQARAGFSVASRLVVVVVVVVVVVSQISESVCLGGAVWVALVQGPCRCLDQSRAGSAQKPELIGRDKLQV